MHNYQTYDIKLNTTKGNYAGKINDGGKNESV